MTLIVASYSMQKEESADRNYIAHAEPFTRFLATALDGIIVALPFVCLVVIGLFTFGSYSGVTDQLFHVGHSSYTSTSEAGTAHFEMDVPVILEMAGAIFFLLFIQCVFPGVVLAFYVISLGVLRASGIGDGNSLSALLFKIQLGMVAFLAVVEVINWLYHAKYESSKGAATPGKRIFNLTVLDADGNSPSFGRATARHFLKPAGELLFFFGFPISLLHDQLTGCFVQSVSKSRDSDGGGQVASQ